MSETNEIESVDEGTEIQILKDAVIVLDGMDGMLVRAAQSSLEQVIDQLKRQEGRK